MPSIINSDDGVVSGTSGLKTTGGNDGILALQNNGTTNVTVTAAGNVGIGTTSPNIGGANADNAILTLKGKASTRGGIFEMGNFGTTGNDQTLGWNRYFDGSTENASIEVARASSTSTAYIKFSTNGGSGSTERARITSDGNFQFNSGYGSVATAFGCRAWVNFNGTGTVAIRGSGNVSSITDNSLANYSVNMATAMPDANYSICGTVGRGAGFTAPRIIGVGNTNPTASVAQVSVVDDAGNLQDCEYTMVAIIR